MKPFNNRKELLTIFKKYLEGKATTEEKLFVEKWYESFEETSGVIDSLSEVEQDIIEQRMEQILRKHVQEAPIRPRWGIFLNVLSSRKLAASILVLFLAGFWYYIANAPQKKSSHSVVVQDLTPGGNKATLTLSDGSQISLGNASIGILAQQGNTMIHKVEDGLISYKKNGTVETGRFNTIKVPAGGKYGVALSDGSRVWLNAESSITFPTVFSKHERSVNITGEVYFEVAKDKQRPFYVQVGSVQKVKVLGTQFNINAYRDEGAVTTTLLEGSVEIINEKSQLAAMTLKPGEQSKISRTGQLRVLNEVNTEAIVAWKNGMFQFEKASIETVMRELGRWYNVEIVFDATAPNREFSGKIDRNLKASEAFEVLKFTGLNFRIESLPSGTTKGKVTVLP